MSNDPLSKLTSADAVIEAMAECDAMGRENFLKAYGYKYSRKYPLHFGGKVYDSKAIVGVAFGKQHGKPLRFDDFSGGLKKVIPTLERLGFPIRTTPHPANFLTAGTTYFRKALVELYGGQLQAGIWTPKEFPVVFIFSGDSGTAFGYKDGWADGVFQYTGEGQVGDMTFTGGNKAIRDHRQNRKDILLFKDLGKGRGVRFEGLFECASWREIQGEDRNKHSRKIIVFDLVPVATAANELDSIESEVPVVTKPISLEELRKAAYAASGTPGVESKPSNAKRSWYERSAKVRDYVLARAQGTCEACDEDAPFVKRNGAPYLEPHHTTRLADEGPDHPAWVAAICPTCHRRIHSGKDGAEWNHRLEARLKEKEPNH